MQEDITHGQRVEEFTVEVLTPDGWTVAASGTTIGYKRLLRFPEVVASALRLRLTATRSRALIACVGAYFAPHQEEDGDESLPNDLPHEGWNILASEPLTIDFGREIRLAAFTYAPYNAEARPDMAFRYTLYSSADGKAWQTVVASGEFGNIMHNPSAQTVRLEKPVGIRYLRIEANAPDGRTARVMPEEIGFTTCD